MGANTVCAAIYYIVYNMKNANCNICTVTKIKLEATEVIHATRAVVSLVESTSVKPVKIYAASN